MFDIYLFRHAEAGDRGPDGRDASRTLTDRGRTEVRQAALGLRRLGVKLDLVLTSPLIRARETGEIASDLLKPSNGTRVSEALAPRGDHESLFREMSGLEMSRLMLVGHQPDLGELASLLVWGAPDAGIALKKAGLIHVVTEALPPAAKGELHWLLTGSQLAMIGRSEETSAP